jgi:uncharacterized membrane protein YedE/YeeE
MRPLGYTLLIGFGLGFSLSRIGFSSWDEVHRMFVFADLRMLLTFMVAVALLLGAWRVIAARTGATWSPRRLHRGVIPGSLLFGAGWALAGACPAIALVQLGEGQLGGLATLVGILCGNALYPLAHRRWFGWAAASCRDD